jgi:hypothetical protein
MVLVLGTRGHIFQTKRKIDWGFKGTLGQDYSKSSIRKQSVLAQRNLID